MQTTQIQIIWRNGEPLKRSKRLPFKSTDEFRNLQKDNDYFYHQLEENAKLNAIHLDEKYWDQLNKYR